MAKGPAPKLSDEEFIRLWKEHGSFRTIAKITGYDPRSVRRKRRIIEERNDVQLVSKHFNTDIVKHNYRNIVRRVKGTVLIFSDAHVWSDEPFQPAYWSMLQLIQDLQPSVIVANGDVFDCASVSRFPPNGFENIPTLAQELETAKIFLNNIEKVAPKNCNLVFTIGNHDQRWATRIASVAKEWKGVKGIELSDHFPSWQFCWSLVLNENVDGGETLIKHRMNNGIHGAYNNVLRSGLHVITGHSHALRAVPYNDWRRRRWAVECGMLSALPINAGSKFLYAEDNVSQNTIGFCVLTYDDKYKLLPPELVEQLPDERVIFRGKELQKWKGR